MSEIQVSPSECPHCGKTMRPGLVKTAMWYGEKLYVVEDIPAQVCEKCVEQFYDEETTDALRRLTEEGFPFAEAKSEILVPVFTLKGHSTPARAMADETYEQ
ncbi:YgiT-type zinc finger protein [Petrachloros mirabilis]